MKKIKDLEKANDQNLKKIKSLEIQLKKCDLDHLKDVSNLFESQNEAKNADKRGKDKLGTKHPTEENDKENADLKTLFSGKNCGFTRVGPQASPIVKNNIAVDDAVNDSKCKICGMLCENMVHLNDHMRVHTEDGDWTCNNCSFQTNSKPSLRKHLQLTKHVSPLISLESNSQSNLENNMKPANHSSSNISPLKQISCKQCDKIFNKIEDLKTHRITNHKT